jgi:hypothetical protein
MKTFEEWKAKYFLAPQFLSDESVFIEEDLKAAFNAGQSSGIAAAAKVAEEAAAMWAKPEIKKANLFAVIRKEECEGVALSIRALGKGEKGDGSD